MSTQERTGTKFTGNTYEAVVAVYTRPDNGSKNKMVIYKLYALRSLNVLFAGSDGGIEPPEVVNVTITGTFEQMPE